MHSSFFTIIKRGLGDYREKGSKFLAEANPVANEDEIREVLLRLKGEHPKCSHICYSYRLDLDGKLFRANDDGEPSGTAGKPILGQIDSKELTKVLVTVVRYYGGKNLGASGLIHAYKTSAAEALEQAGRKEIKIRSYYEISFEYPRMNDVMRMLKHDELKILGQDYDNNCKLTFSIPVNHSEVVLKELGKIYDITTKLQYTK